MLESSAYWVKSTTERRLPYHGARIIPYCAPLSFTIKWVGAIVRVGDLVQKTKGELERLPNIGRRSLDEVEEMLSLMGLHLGTEVPGWPPETNQDIVRPDEFQS
jgi:hypothetical protein